MYELNTTQQVNINKFLVLLQYEIFICGSFNSAVTTLLIISG